MRFVVGLGYGEIRIPSTNGTIVVDLTPLYPASLTPAICNQIRAFQLENYKDLFFVSPPDWFVLYSWMELIFHLPVAIWSIRALLVGTSICLAFPFPFSFWSKSLQESKEIIKGRRHEGREDEDICLIQ